MLGGKELVGRSSLRWMQRQATRHVTSNEKDGDRDGIRIVTLSVSADAIFIRPMRIVWNLDQQHYLVAYDNANPYPYTSHENVSRCMASTG